MKISRFSIAFFSFLMVYAFSVFATAAIDRSEKESAAQVLAQQFTRPMEADRLQAAVQTAQSMDAQIKHSVESAIRDRAVMAKIDSEIEQQLRPDILVPSFFESFSHMRAQIDDDREAWEKLNRHQQQAVQGSGSISGTVIVGGAVPAHPVRVLAFDRHGYFFGSSSTDAEGVYRIWNLVAGAYYVMTESDYCINAIYPNVIAPMGSRETWRMATAVDVVDDQMTGGIDFVLQTGNPVKVTLYREDGMSKFEDQNVWFFITPADNPDIEIAQIHNESNGIFNLLIPAAGAVKIGARVAGYQTTWYPGVEWAFAEPVQLVEGGAMPVLSFNLWPLPQGPETGGISGRVWPEDSYLSILALVFVFDAEDTSLVAMNNVLELNGLFGSYSIDNLLPKEYYVYANDYLGSLVGAGDYLGEFYDGARTPAEATLVKVTANERKENINFTLLSGASISGRVMDQQGQPVDSLIVLAVNADLGGPGKDPFLTRVQLGLAVTDLDGRYEITGLPDGDYYVRTFSDYMINADLGGLSDVGDLIAPGKHAGEIIDIYYGGIANIFRFGDAERVPLIVGEVTNNINFQLPPVGTISGSVRDAHSGAAVHDVAIVALDAATGYPYLPLVSGYADLPGKKIDPEGQFSITPLPPGQYKLLALSGLQSSDLYLSQYFSGTCDFEQAEIVVLDGNTVSNKDFSLNKGATVQGFIRLASDFSAGADTLWGFPVIAFDAATGKTVGYDYVQFTGGYRIDRLPAGSYKIMALPVVAPYAASYLGGGNAFDQAVQTIAVAAGDIQDGVSIDLARATGKIRGSIRDGETGEALSTIGVLAYDLTGHLVGFGMSGIDLSSGMPFSDPGFFEVTGLKTGSYYLRTLSFTRATALLEMAEEMLDGLMGDGDLMDQVGGLLSTVLDLDLDFQVYQDIWNGGGDAWLAFNLYDFIFDLTRHGFVNSYDQALLPLHVPLPFAVDVPDDAVAVFVDESTPTSGLVFDLFPGDLDDQVVSVDENPSTALPNRFTVMSNYPNPFNPTTRLKFILPQRAEIRVAVYDNLGRRVRSLIDAAYEAGEYQVTWDGRDDSGKALASGLYFARFESEHQTLSVKMLMIK
ncbi:T9SS type A sorting domain-containing protein [candidate division KSB1 bacterium]|nr:T9SS type A sorting domain-containing protein [candidate division KSB1 bacterium]